MSKFIINYPKNYPTKKDIEYYLNDEEEENMLKVWAVHLGFVSRGLI